MKTKTLMSKVTLGAAIVLTTATVATTAVVPNVVRADDTVVTDKDAKIYTVYGFDGWADKASYNDIYGSGLLGKQVFKLRDFEYTTADPFTGLWNVGPNGEKNWDPNSSTTEPTTPSTTEPTTPTSEKPEDVTKPSTQTTTSTPTKTTEEIDTLPKAGDASILSMLAGTGILSGFGLTSLKRKFKK